MGFYDPSDTLTIFFVWYQHLGKTSNIRNMLIYEFGQIGCLYFVLLLENSISGQFLGSKTGIPDLTMTFRFDRKS